MVNPTSIYREIRQSRPFETKRQEAVVSMMRTASLLRNLLGGIAQTEGITIQQYNALRIIRGSDGSISTREVGERLVEPTPGTSRLLDRLERKGLIRRVRSADDRRCVLCSLTEEGASVVERLDGPLNEAGEDFLSLINDVELAALLSVLDKARAGYYERFCPETSK